MALIRGAEREDIERIVAFQRAMAEETEGVELDEATLKRGVRAVFDGPERGRYLVAEEENRVVGSLLITNEWSDWRNGWIWWIQSVWVMPEFRGRGIYRAMYERILDEAAGRDDVVGVRLYVDRRNTAAQEVYRRLGMDGDHYIVFEAMDQ